MKEGIDTITKIAMDFKDFQKETEISVSITPDEVTAKTGVKVTSYA